jgi:hypothetical protein
MSGYLMRLVTRTPMGRSMQPFVRSTSPVAERDQRIGMTGFEGFELDDSTSAQGDSDAGVEQGGALQPPMSPAITPTSDPSGAIMQRKVASPAASPVRPASHPVPSSSAFRASMETSIQSEEQRTDGIDAPSPSDSVPSSGPPMTDERLPARQTRAAPPSPPFSLKNATADFAWPVSSTDDGGVEAPSPDSSEAHDAERHLDQGAMRTQPDQQARKVSPSRLEPPARTFAEQIGQSPIDASMPAAGPDEGPRVFIGRINIEVVPPPATQPSTAAPRPLTAASVSVIGPLGGGIPSNLRLSLRHR